MLPSDDTAAEDVEHSADIINSVSLTRKRPILDAVIERLPQLSWYRKSDTGKKRNAARISLAGSPEAGPATCSPSEVPSSLTVSQAGPILPASSPTVDSNGLPAKSAGYKPPQPPSSQQQAPIRKGLKRPTATYPARSNISKSKDPYDIEVESTPEKPSENQARARSQEQPQEPLRKSSQTGLEAETDPTPPEPDPAPARRGRVRPPKNPVQEATSAKADVPKPALTKSRAPRPAPTLARGSESDSEVVVRSTPIRRVKRTKASTVPEPTRSSVPVEQEKRVTRSNLNAVTLEPQDFSKKPEHAPVSTRRHVREPSPILGEDSPRTRRNIRTLKDMLSGRSASTSDPETPAQAPHPLASKSNAPSSLRRKAMNGAANNRAATRAKSPSVFVGDSEEDEEPLVEDSREEEAEEEQEEEEAEEGDELEAAVERQLENDVRGNSREDAQVNDDADAEGEENGARETDPEEDPVLQELQEEAEDEYQDEDDAQEEENVADSSGDPEELVNWIPSPLDNHSTQADFVQSQEIRKILESKKNLGCDNAGDFVGPGGPTTAIGRALHKRIEKLRGAYRQLAAAANGDMPVPGSEDHRLVLTRLRSIKLDSEKLIEGKIKPDLTISNLTGKRNTLLDVYLYVIPGLVTSLKLAIEAYRDEGSLRWFALKELKDLMTLIYQLSSAAVGESARAQPSSGLFKTKGPTKSIRSAIGKMRNRYAIEINRIEREFEDAKARKEDALARKRRREAEEEERIREEAELRRLREERNRADEEMIRKILGPSSKRARSSQYVAPSGIHPSAMRSRQPSSSQQSVGSVPFASQQGRRQPSASQQSIGSIPSASQQSRVAAVREVKSRLEELGLADHARQIEAEALRIQQEEENGVDNFPEDDDPFAEPIERVGVFGSRSPNKRKRVDERWSDEEMKILIEGLQEHRGTSLFSNNPNSNHNPAVRDRQARCYQIFLNIIHKRRKKVNADVPSNRPRPLYEDCGQAG